MNAFLSVFLSIIAAVIVVVVVVRVCMAFFFALCCLSTRVSCAPSHTLHFCHFSI